MSTAYYNSHHALPTPTYHYQTMSKNSPNRARSVTPLASTSTGSSSGKSRSSSAKPVNIFSSDGSFLERVRHTMKEEDEKKKAQEILERKKHFADRFKQRGKRPHLSSEQSSGTSGTDSQDPMPEAEPSHKKQKLDGESSRTVQGGDTKQSGNAKEAEQSDADRTTNEGQVKDAQAEYRDAVGSYPTSLKDSGTGVRPLAK